MVRAMLPLAPFSSTPSPIAATIDWGRTRYADAWRRQNELVAQRVAGDVGDTLVLTEHEPVFTLGLRAGADAHLVWNAEQLEREGVEVVKTNRGGDITYHGPGQIVGYPIFDLDHHFTDVHRFLRTLEEAVIGTLEAYKIKSGRIEGLTGVWLDGDDPAKARKICAFGIRASRWVTMHGFAFNVNTDISYFDQIIPCGIADKGVTCMAKELGGLLDMDEVKARLKLELTDLFDVELVA